ncbi:hypothetical protein [Micromonospora deserti]|uniref:Uncharacterized protein n=1 Tax=Micromonospora deserti TaxID=2070366 RepID=A0A2W2DC24_9ACTN|nr:hypothetical protein [Micromonospora deserti]PZG01499.1 hypothetical protein C1I99_06705 [Micromonospora deserti]
MTRRTGRPSYLLPRPDTRRPHTSRFAAVVVAVGLAVAVLAGATGYATGRPDDTTSAIAEMRAVEARRDTQQISDLTTTARRLREELSPILSAFTAPAGAPQPEAGQLRQWQQAIQHATQAFADPPSGTTATNVARGGLRAAVDQAALAVDTYLLALTAPPAQRAALTDLATRQATQAAATWSVAAAQLDQINIDAGHGHQHVYLDTSPGSGAFTPDGAQEGTGS